MNLDDFEDEIDSPLILSRGLSYYRGKSVMSLEMSEPNTYTAHVAGTRLYEVTITLDDDREIEDSSCTCPYDWGEYCKHEVAVMYALRHHLNSTQHTMVERPKEVDLEALLEGRSKKELLSFLLDLAKKRPDVASALVVAFPSPDQEENQTNLGIEFRKACDNGLESVENEDMYEWDTNEDEDDWQFTAKFKKKIDELLLMAKVAIIGGDIRHGASIASMMVHEITFMDYEGDCFEEEVRAFVMQVTALFDDVPLNIDDASWLFSLFFADAKDDEFCSQKALLKLCLKFATTESDQEDLRNYLVALASDQPEGRWGVHTTAFTCLELQHALLMKQNRVEDAQAFALANLAYDGMRTIAFDHAMEIKDYALAEKLAKEKESSAYQSSDATGWSVLLFRVYQESGKKDEMRSLAKAFLLHGNLSYYPILKESYEGEEWEALVDGLLDEMQAREEGGYRKNAYPEVLKAECKQERLLTYLQRNPRLVQSYQDVLLPTYKAEVFALYKQIILEDGQKTDSRKEYNILASWLKALVVIGGGSVATECLEVLAPRYMKRPAMRDELQQVGLL